MNKGNVLRIYPNHRQRVLIEQQFGCCRFVYNMFIDINQETKDLNTRQWTCPKCRTEHDRDINAAKNIIKYALTII